MCICLCILKALTIYMYIYIYTQHKYIYSLWKKHLVYRMRVFKVNTERIPGRRNRAKAWGKSVSLLQVLHVQRDDLLGTKYHLKSFFSLSTIEKKSEHKWQG